MNDEFISDFKERYAWLYHQANMYEEQLCCLFPYSCKSKNDDNQEAWIFENIGNQATLSYGLPVSIIEYGLWVYSTKQNIILFKHIEHATMCALATL